MLALLTQLAAPDELLRVKKQLLLTRSITLHKATSV